MKTIRTVAAVAFFAISAGAVSAVTQSIVLGHRDPAMALRLWPWNAEARGVLAGRQVLASHATQANALARRAVREMPGDAVALRALGLSEAQLGRPKEGARIMALAGAASRRDLATNLWFIEHSVEHRDIPSAIRYYDYALRTEDGAEQLLYPILAPALNDPEIAEAVGERLAQHPIWTDSFLHYAFASGVADRPLIGIVGRLSQAPSALPLRFTQEFTQQLAKRDNLAGLAALGRQTGHPMVEGPGRIPARGSLSAIDWTSPPGARSSLYPDGEFGLSFTANKNGVLADRVVALKPGSYALRIDARSTSGKPYRGIELMLSCASNGPHFTPAANGAPLDVRIPERGCDLQRLSIAIDDADLAEGGAAFGTIASVDISRI